MMDLKSIMYVILQHMYVWTSHSPRAPCTWVPVGRGYLPGSTAGFWVGNIRQVEAGLGFMARDSDSVNSTALGSLGEGNGTPLQYSCLENPMGRGAWWAAVHGVANSRTWLSDFTFTFRFCGLEKEMATHSGVLAWRIPGTGETGGLLSMGSHRVGHDWSDLAAAAGNLNTYMNASYSGRLWRRRWHPTPVLLPRKSHGRRSLVGCSPWGR